MDPQCLHASCFPHELHFLKSGYNLSSDLSSADVFWKAIANKCWPKIDKQMVYSNALEFVTLCLIG